MGDLDGGVPKTTLDESDVGPVQVTIETVDLWVVEDLAYETGKWSYTFTSPDAERRTIGGRYVTVWKRQAEGSWKILGDLGVPGN